MLKAGSDGKLKGGGGCNLPVVAYSGGVLMLIHRFRRGLVREN